MIHTKKARVNVGKPVNDLIDKSLSEITELDYWRLIGEKLSQLQVKKPKIYLEGYSDQPITIESRAGEFESTGTPETDIIGQFLDRVGGTLETTEDPALLDQHIKLLKNSSQTYLDDFSLATEDLAALRRVQDMDYQARSLIIQRDAFIAKMIAGTLKDGETGILFLGAEHNVESKLSDDINVELLDRRLKEMGIDTMIELRGKATKETYGRRLAERR